jgi:hypothetical protein
VTPIAKTAMLAMPGTGSMASVGSMIAPGCVTGPDMDRIGSGRVEGKACEHVIVAEAADWQATLPLRLGTTMISGSMRP